MQVNIKGNHFIFNMKITFFITGKNEIPFISFIIGKEVLERVRLKLGDKQDKQWSWESTWEELETPQVAILMWQLWDVKIKRICVLQAPYTRGGHFLHRILQKSGKEEESDEQVWLEVTCKKIGGILLEVPRSMRWIS